MISRRSPWAPVLAALLLVPFLGAPAHADNDADPTNPPVPNPPASSPRDLAEQALATVEELIEPPAGDGADTGDGTDTGESDPASAWDLRSQGKDLTLALRDLAAARADLPKDQRERASRLLARPTDAGSTCNDPDKGDLVCYRNPTKVQTRCNSLLCVHWVSRTFDGRNGIPGENDGPGGAYPGKTGGLPDYVELTLATMTYVAQTYRDAGYRPVVGDGTAGGNDRPDIYLGQLGDVGAYGYCTTDDWSVTDHVPAPGYCVLDNNYSEFGISPRSALRVTAAHEWFHAVQFAYDLNADAWLMEATATWAEDELYDGINDNRAYLPYGPLARPQQSLDLFSDLSQYGTWVFFRYLSERYPTTAGGLPVIVREIWRRLAHDGGEGAASMYSVEALRSALAARHTSLADQLAWFTVWNRRPSVFYDEGAAYRASPTRRSYALTPRRPSGAARFGLDHLAASTVRFTRGANLSGSWMLRLKVNLNDTAIGSRAVLTIKRTGLPARAVLIGLNGGGNRALDVAFGPRVEWVDVTALNTSTRYGGCDDPARDATSTCHGFSIDDNRGQVIAAKAYRR